MSIYPIISEKTKTLPFFITSIGNDDFQKPCIRNNGFAFHHLITVLDGCGVIECNNVKEFVAKGDIFFIKKNIPHSYYSNGNIFSTQWVTFDGTAVESVLKAYNIDQFKLIKDINLDKIKNSFDILYNKVDSRLNDYEISAYLYTYITAFFNCTKATKISQSMEKAIEYIKKHFSECITLESLAEVCEMNKFTFCREFKNTYSTSSFNYLMQIRITQAKKFLTDSNVKIQDIASLTGFNDTGYFCRTFKKFENCTPSEFRNTIKKDG